MKDNQDHFEVLRKIQNRPNSTQRELASELGTLGKLNYYKSSSKKPVKIENFKKSNKINYFYVLTPAGLAEKTKLTINFKRKMKEYDELKKELMIKCGL